MKCEKATELILSSDDAVSAELKEHILKCKKCRQITEEWLALKTLETRNREVPRSIDFVICREAAAFQEKRVNHATGNRTFFRWLSFASAAACVVLFALACFSLLKGNKSAMDERASITVAARTANEKPLYRKPGICWSDIDMKNEIFELSAEIELNLMLLKQSSVKREFEDFNKVLKMEMPQDLLT